MKLMTSESIDENYVYVDDEDADERVISCHFLEKIPNKAKVKLLRGMADYLEEIHK